MRDHVIGKVYEWSRESGILHNARGMPVNSTITNTFRKMVPTGLACIDCGILEIVESSRCVKPCPLHFLGWRFSLDEWML
jgi:hypothetical protein